jgi:hypothetical protein
LKKTLRKIVVNDTIYWWRVKHQHQDGRHCAEVFSAYRDGAKTARLVVTFGRNDQHGPLYIQQDGVIMEYTGARRVWNLHLPRVARALIERAGQELPRTIDDGWLLLAAAMPDGAQ